MTQHQFVGGKPDAAFFQIRAISQILVGRKMSSSLTHDINASILTGKDVDRDLGSQLRRQRPHQFRRIAGVGQEDLETAEPLEGSPDTVGAAPAGDGRDDGTDKLLLEEAEVPVAETWVGRQRADWRGRGGRGSKWEEERQTQHQHCVWWQEKKRRSFTEMESTSVGAYVLIARYFLFFSVKVGES